MARCGCNTAMSTTCDAIMSCVAANLGAGLDYNEATGDLELRISTDAGNTAAIGSDDGFYAPASPGPGEMVWRRTVAALPAQAISAVSGGSLVGAASAPQMIDYCIANGIDMYSTAVFGVADATMYEQVGGIETSVTTYTDNPGDLTNRYISSLTMQQMYYDAGSRVNPTSRNSNAPTSLLTPDGGWGGFYAPVYKPRTIDETLRIIRGQMVVELSVQRAVITTDRIEADLRATVAAVVAAGAQPWVIIHVPALLSDNSRAPINDWVPIVTGAGIAAGVNLNSEYLMTSPFTPAEIVASGATWATVITQSRPNGSSDARITALVGAGLEVVATTSGRQYWTTHAFGLGVRAVRSADPVYSRGVRGLPGDLDYRQNLVPGVASKTTATGALTPVTDPSSSMWDGGFARNDLPGRWFPVRYGAEGTTPRTRVHQILGTICPIPNTTNYRITLRARRETSAPLSSNQVCGVSFALPDDRDISNLSTQPVKANYNGYQVLLRSQPASGSFASLQLYRVTAGLTTSLGSVTNGASWRVGEWATIVVTVTPADVTASATDSLTTSTITSADTTYRGAYAMYNWGDSPGGFVQGYDNPANLVMYEALA